MRLWFHSHLFSEAQPNPSLPLCVPLHQSPDSQAPALCSSTRPLPSDRVPRALDLLSTLSPPVCESHRGKNLPSLDTDVSQVSGSARCNGCLVISSYLTPDIASSPRQRWPPLSAESTFLGAPCAGLSCEPRTCLLLPGDSARHIT